MSPILWMIILILGAVALFLVILVIKSFLEPKKISSIKSFIKQGRYAQAGKAAKLLITKEPRNGLAHYYLGICYLQDGKGELALMEFKTVNQISQFGSDLSEIEFRHKMAELYFKYNQPEESLKEYLVLIKIEPHNADNYYWAGKIFDSRNRSDMSVQYLRKAVEVNPRHGNAHFMLGFVQYREKKPVEAKAEFENAIRFDPNNTDSFFYLGKLQKDGHDYTAALLSFEKASKNQELKVKSLVERGGCYLSLNDYDRAIPELERAIKNGTDEGANEILYARYFLAMAYEKQRNLDQAIDQWEKIYKKKPNFKDVAEKLANYQEFRSDDRIKDYLTCSREDFLQICNSIVLSAMNLVVRDISDTPGSVDIIVVEQDSGKWLGTRKLPKLYRFLRTADMIDESVLRKLMEDMKKVSIVRSGVITSSAFTRTAIEFAENRSVELFNKEKLQELLNKTDFFKKSGKS